MWRHSPWLNDIVLAQWRKYQLSVGLYMFRRIKYLFTLIFYTDSVFLLRAAVVFFAVQTSPITHALQQESVVLAQQMYVAYYGRAGDPGGLNYWASQFDKSSNLDAVLLAFGDSKEYNDRFSTVTKEALVNGLFIQMFNRNADLEGLAFYLGRLENGEATLASIAKQIADGSASNDKLTLANKIEGANAFTQFVDSNTLPYTSADIENVRHFMSTITEDSATITSVISAMSITAPIANWVISGDTVCTDSGNRTLLRFCNMTEGSGPGSRVDLNAYAPIGDASIASNNFEGNLSLTGEASAGDYEVVLDLSDLLSPARQHLPEFEFDFVQDGDVIIPLQRGVIQRNVGGHASWEYILEPGRVWDEAADRGYSRAVIPFALQERNANCIHNGVLTFLFNNMGDISKVAYQISAETCQYFKLDLWGLLEASYTPAAVVNAQAVKTNYAAHVASRMQVKAISMLATDYPAASLQLGQFSASVTAAHMTAYGLVIGDVHYTGGCETRNGTYPYCDVMVLPSYSIAKSAFASMALMRLEQKYPGAKDTAISHHVPECIADGDSDWSDVSFENAIDMATGHYTSSVYDVDEANFSGFVNPIEHSDKITYSCTAHPRNDTPGDSWVYHTSDTYIAATAMNDYVRVLEGQDKDIFTDTLVGEIWRPLKLSPTALVSKRSYDDIAQAWGGYGLNFHRDDVAKLGRFLNADNGMIDSVQILDSTLLSEALQTGDSAPYGLPTGILADLNYHKGYWAQAVSFADCPGKIWIPNMSGFGGIKIVLLPNGMTYYYFSDNNEFEWTAAAVEAHKITSMCAM